MLSDTEQQPFLKAYSDDPSHLLSSPSSPHLAAEKGRRRTCWHRILTHLPVFIVTSLAWLLALLFLVPAAGPFTFRHWSSADVGYAGDPNRQNVTSGARLLECGNSAPEARAAGCTYDILLNAWVPAPCVDPEWLDEYTDDLSWGGYADANLTQLLTVEEMGAREFYYTSVRDHINHCAIMWRKQFWVLFEMRAAMDTLITNGGHTEHCTQYLMDIVGDPRTEPTKTVVGFAGCWVR